jgi:molybdopterin synthase sulfur carrier subunit
VRVLYFAWLRARIGCAEEELALPPEIRDVASLLAWLKARGPRHAEALRDLSVVRVAVNQDYVGGEHPVHAGDEVAIFPPMTGG